MAKELDYHVMELNASDTRSKRSLSEELASVIGNKVRASISYIQQQQQHE